MVSTSHAKRTDPGERKKKESKKEGGREGGREGAQAFVILPCGVCTIH